jgi:PadR family transcriptional regulator PadR
VKQTELLKGILEGLVLAIIQRKETYGYEITKILNDQGFTEIVEGTVYTILLRLEKNQWVIAEKKPSEKGPMRKFYRLTSSGEAELADFWQRWTLLSKQVNKMKKMEG